jgi:hypothetical protein
MFNAISWGQYIGWLFLALALYYAYVGLVYYRVELLCLVKGKGKGNAAADAPAPAKSLSSSTGKGPLIAKSALSSPASAPQATKPAKAPAEPTTTEPDEEFTDQAHEEPTSQVHEQESAEESELVDELPDLDLPTAEYSEYISVVDKNKSLSDDAKASNFTEEDDITSALPTQATALEPESSRTIGIAQLGDFLERAVERQLTPEEMVEQEPALENTDVLLAFLQAQTESVQRATSHIYAGVAEEALS